MKRSYVVLLTFLFFLCGIGQSNALTIESTFDTGTEGWTVYNQASLNWSSTGGNPDGYLRFDDSGPDGYGTNAPSKFLGDLSLFDGGYLSFDYRVIRNSPDPNSGVGTVKFWTSATDYLGLNFIGEPLPTSTDWTTYSKALTADEWGVDQNDWMALLSNVTRISIFVEPGGYPDACGLDNVRMFSPASEPVPEPSTIVLMGLGLVGLAGMGRKKLLKK
ncbi:MAG: PEP-CTERM sorting domain-containing protein [Deltaproteobacteria bacterium]|nr:PEP-CTERM sorting domain-containing protein [Deltaproteobacteria bacterium]